MYLFMLCAVIFVLTYYFYKKIKYDEFKTIPGPPTTFLFGNALDFLKTPVEIFYQFRDLSIQYPDMFKIEMGPLKFLVITNPEDAEVLTSKHTGAGADEVHVPSLWYFNAFSFLGNRTESCRTVTDSLEDEILISSTKHITKGFLYTFIKPWLKEGLLLSDGSKWHERRKILTPAFHFNILRHFHTILEENSRKLVETLQPEIGKPRTDIGSFVVPYTLHSICETAMGVKLDADKKSKSYKDSILRLGELIVYRAARVWFYPNIFFHLSGIGKLHNKIINFMSSFRDEVIEQRRTSDDHKNLLNDIDNNAEEISIGKGKKMAMLDLLLKVQKRGIIDDKGIGEEVDTFMFEGHDTTSSALQFVFMLLANHQECQEKIIQEYRSVVSDDSQTVTMNDLSQLKYLECCIKESLRLYPPVYFMSRKLTERTKFKNYEVPAGTDCTIMIYALHRLNKTFKDPYTFRPERFVDEVHTWHPYAYLPFSAGPRNCIGQKFAMMELKLAISSVLLRYKLLPVTRPSDIVIYTHMILRPEHPIYVQIVNREHV